MIGIIGDVHLGASLKAGTRDPVTGSYSRMDDYEKTLMYTIAEIAKTCKVLVFTGDIFEHRHATMYQQRVFSRALHLARSLGLEIHIVVGNHDQQRSNNATTLSYLKELHLEKIHIHEDLDAVRYEGHVLYFLPYRDRKFLECTSYDDGIEKIGNLIGDLRKQHDDCQGKHVLVGHMAIEGTFFPPEDSDIYADNELMLPKSMFKDFDITVMGHVHTPGNPGPDENIYYVGSMEKRGTHERGAKKFLVLHLDEGEMTWHDEPCRNFVEVKMDFSGEQKKSELSKAIIDGVIENAYVKNQILKMSVRISSEDLIYIDKSLILSELSKLEPSFILPIAYTSVSSRIMKTPIESETDEESWVNYCKTIEGFESIILEKGLEIISGAEE